MELVGSKSIHDFDKLCVGCELYSRMKASNFHLVYCHNHTS